MTLTIKFPKTLQKGTDTAIIFAFADKTLTPSAKEFDKRSKGFIADIIKRDKKFTGKMDEVKIIPLPNVAPFAQVIVFGLGKPEKLTELKAQNAGGKLLTVLEGANAAKGVVFADPLKNSKNTQGAAFFAHLAYGIKLRAYKFDKYKTKKKGDDKSFAALDILNSAPSEKIFKGLDAIAQGVYFARDAVNEPPNHLYPDTFARRIYDELTPHGVDVDIIDERKMAKLGMGAALAVGVGSDHPPRMVVMRLNGKKKSKGPVAFVGKGITFDTGGISLKPGAGMEEMKMDMGGAAAVAGVMKALALRGSKADVVGIAAIAENMPSGRAYRPSDILKSYSGKTIEVLNTDAEGRLVLADALSYIQKEYKPSLIVDLATLTGAMMVALGHEYCGVFANDDSLWSKIENAGRDAGEKVWRMPLDEAWKKEMVGTITDLKNLGNGRNAGACTAAGFLEHFIENKTPWAHMDIAGTAWVKSDQPTVPRYGTGYGVRLLNRFVQDNYE